MADPFVIYTLGDTAMFDGALNGVAMLFKDTDLLSGNGYLGLGFGAFFGAVILLIIMVYNAAFKQQFELRTLLMPLVLYIVLTGPKVDVAIYDVYSTNTRTVDNIPIGLAIPASVASGIAKILTEIIETAYQVVSGNGPSDYMPRITQEGYVTPLKLINSLRQVASISPSPLLVDSMKSIYQKCLHHNTAFSATDFQQAPDPLYYIIRATGQNLEGSGVVYVSLAANGRVEQQAMTCPDAAKALEKNVYAFIDGNNIQNNDPNMVGDVSIYNLTKAIRDQVIANGDGTGATSSINTNGSNYGYEGVLNALGNLAGIGETEARQFIASTLLNPMLKTASHCTEKYGDMTQLSKCTAWVSSVNQWEEKNAAAGTGFLKVMKDGQNILIMLSFLLFPIVVILIMFQGPASFKILGNYMAFTVAAYLWLPLASIINFYIQTSLAEEFYKVSMENGGITTLNMVTGPKFYAAVSQKLSLANGLLASVPVLSMMLFSGMMMGMNALASRMNSADTGEYDAKVNSPDAVKSAPMATTNSAVSGNGQGIYQANGGLDNNINFSQSLSAIQSKNQAISAQSSMTMREAESLVKGIAASSGITKASSATVSNEQGSTTSHGTVESNNNTHGTASDVNAATTNTVATGNNISDQTGQADSRTISWQGQGQGSWNSNKSKNPQTGNQQTQRNVTGEAGVGGSIVGGNTEASSNSNSTNFKTEDGNSLKLNDQNKQATQDMMQKFKQGTATESDVRSYMNSLNKDSAFTNSISANKTLDQQWQNVNSSLDKISNDRQSVASMSSSLQGNASQMATTSMRGENNQEYAQLKAEMDAKNDPNQQARIEDFKNRYSKQIAGNDEAVERAAYISAGVTSEDSKIASLAAATIDATPYQKAYNQNASQVNVGTLNDPQEQVNRRLEGNGEEISNATAGVRDIKTPNLANSALSPTDLNHQQKLDATNFDKPSNRSGVTPEQVEPIGQKNADKYAQLGATQANKAQENAENVLKRE